MRLFLPHCPAFAPIIPLTTSPTASVFLVAALLIGCEGTSVTTKTPLADSNQNADGTGSDVHPDSGAADAEGTDDAAAGSDAEDGNTDCGKVVWAQAKSAFLNICAECHDVPDGVFKAHNCASTAARKSKIKSEVSKNYMPPDGGMSDADKQLIIQWVNDGALCACP